MKTIITSEVSSNNDIEVTTNDDDVYISLDETKIVAKVVAVDLKIIAETYLCSNCNVSVSIENGLAWCNNCNNVSAQSACKSKAYLGLAVLKDEKPEQLVTTLLIIHSFCLLTYFKSMFYFNILRETSA